MQLIKRGSALFKREKKGDEEEKKDDKKEEKKPDSTPKLLAVPGAPIIPKLGETNEVHRTYARDFRDLPVHKDLPRLAPNISISNKAASGSISPILAKAQPPIDKTRRIHDVLLALVSQLDPQSEGLFRENCSKHIIEPTSSAMVEFFKSVDEGATPKHKTLRLLKACNQSVVAPIFVDLQLNVAPKFPYADGGRWDVEVVLQPSRVTLTHIRLERSLQGLFEFQWRIVFIFDRDITALQHVYFFIEKLTMSPTADPQQTKDLLELLKPVDLLVLQHEVVAVWQKPHHKLPIHKDLPGIAAQIEFLPPSNAATATADRSALESLLHQLTSLFAPEKSAIVKSRYRAVVHAQHVDQTLKAFLREDLQLKDNESLTNVLKCLNSSIIAPVVVQLQTGTGHDYPFKDRLVPRAELDSATRHANAFDSSSPVVNAWRITIDTRNASHGIITHWKQEATIETANPEKSFMFSWQVQLKFDAGLKTLEKVSCSLGDIIFHKDCSAAAKERIRASIAWSLRVQWWQ